MSGRLRLLRLVPVAAGIALLTWTLTTPALREPGGALGTESCLALAGSATLVFVGAALGRRWQRAALWFALAVLGQAVALQLVEAGPFVRYQHYRMPAVVDGGFRLLLVAFIPVQAVLVGLGLRRMWSPLADWLRGEVGSPRLVGVAAVFVLSSAALSASATAYVGELAFASFVQLLGLGNVIVAVAAVPGELRARIDRRLKSILGWKAAPPDARASAGALDPVALVSALWVLLVAGLLAWFAYERHPHVPDEVVYLFHARYIADGMLSMPLPPVREAFDVNLMFFQEDRWFSPVPPGWPAVLSLGVLAGAPWLVNPLLGSVSVLLAHGLLRELYDRGVARTGAVLLALSPWYVFMSMNFMTHALTLTSGLAAALAVARLRRTGRWRWGALGGIFVGLAGLTRPLEGLVVGALLGVWILVRRARRRPAGAAVFGASALVVAGLVFPYNAHFTGDPTRFPLMAYTDKHYGPGTNALGFGPERGLGWPGLDPFPGHGAVDVAVNAALNTFAVNAELLGWSAGGLLLAALFVFSGRIRTPDRLMLGVTASVVGVHSLYWFSGGPDFGARYWYLIIVPLVALTVRGLEFLDENAGRGGVLLGASLLCASALISFFPWRAIDKYHDYRGMEPGVRELAAARNLGRSLVLVRGRRHPDYASAAIYNPVDLDGDGPIYAWDRGPEVTKDVLAAFPDRPIWIVEGPTMTGHSYRVVAGPLPPPVSRADSTCHGRSCP